MNMIDAGDLRFYISFCISALGKLKVRRRYWYMYEESECALLYFKSQEDASRTKEPLGEIDIRGAAITLSLTDNNQFSIL